ncbi:hypothetical protein Tco_0778961 [Tanacetum coccineum]
MAPIRRTTRSTPVTTTPPPVADPTTTTSVTSAQLQAMIDEGVTAVLAARATTRNGDDSHTSGTGVRRNERAVRECTYQDFMKCQPLFFRGTEGVVDLTQWFERMETVFRISNCTRLRESSEFCTYFDLFQEAEQEHEKEHAEDNIRVIEEMMELLNAKFSKYVRTEDLELLLKILRPSNAEILSIIRRLLPCYGDLRTCYHALVPTKSKYSIHPSECLTVLQIKAEHQIQFGFGDKPESISMEVRQYHDGDIVQETTEDITFKLKQKESKPALLDTATLF